MSGQKAKYIDVSALTERDMELLVGALRCAEGGFPKVDWNRFADMCGYKSAASASVSFGTVKKKVMGELASAKATPKKATPKKDGTPSKRKNTAAMPGDDDDDEESPLKKAKTSSKKNGKKEVATKQEAAKKEESDGEAPAFI